MKIVVIGGTGLIGSKLVDLLQQSCLDVVPVSRAYGVNTVTGEGLDETLEDAEVVVDVTKSPSFEEKAASEFFEASGRNIIAAEVKAEIQHHIALSVVGTDRLQESGYFRAKLAQEKLIQESPIPYTILRSTQFFEFLGRIAQSATIGQTVHLTPALFQPVAADDVAETLADITLSLPVNGIVEVAGPERVGMAEIVKRYLIAADAPRDVMPDPKARYFGAVLDDQSLTPGANARIGSQTFEAWLSQSKQAA